MTIAIRVSQTLLAAARAGAVPILAVLALALVFAAAPPPAAAGEPVFFAGVGVLVPAFPESYRDAHRDLGRTGNFGLGLEIRDRVYLTTTFGFGRVDAVAGEVGTPGPDCADTRRYEHARTLYGLLDARFYLRSRAHDGLHPYALAGFGVLSARRKGALVQHGPAPGGGCEVTGAIEGLWEQDDALAYGIGAGLEIPTGDTLAVVVQGRWLGGRTRDVAVDLSNVLLEAGVIVSLE